MKRIQKSILFFDFELAVRNDNTIEFLCIEHMLSSTRASLKTSNSKFDSSPLDLCRKLPQNLCSSRAIILFRFLKPQVGQRKADCIMAPNVGSNSDGDGDGEDNHSSYVSHIETSYQPLDIAFHPNRDNLVAAALVDGSLESKTLIYSVMRCVIHSSGDSSIRVN